VFLPNLEGGREYPLLAQSFDMQLALIDVRFPGVKRTSQIHTAMFFDPFIALGETHSTGIAVTSPAP